MAVLILFILFLGVSKKKNDQHKAVEKETVNKIVEQLKTQKIGAVPCELLYASKEYAMIREMTNLIIYSLKEHEVIQTLDLAPLEMDCIQGDQAAEVRVSKDGKTIYMKRMDVDKELQYRYDFKKNEWKQEKAVQDQESVEYVQRFHAGDGKIPDEKEFGDLLPWSDVLQTGEGQYTYLHLKQDEDTLETLQLVVWTEEKADTYYVWEK